MANNLRKFNTYSDYEAAELVKPAVSLIAATDEVYFDQKEAPVPPTPTMNGDIRNTYNITDTTQPAVIIGFNDDWEAVAFTPTQMWVDGVEVTPSGEYTFSTTGEHIVEFELGSGVTTLPDYAFNMYNDSLTSTIIGGEITSIGQYAFYNCSSLTSIDIPSGVTSIGQYAFVGCSGLTSCTIGSGVTSIGEGVFSGCYSLTSIDIPNSVTSIDYGAFYDCSGLTSITVEATTPPQLGLSTFYNTNNSPIYVPSGSVDAYKAASGWSDYASRIQAIP